ncbi:MAG: hypothetical protein JJE35_05285, partial [Thermoleophilia bacterium]|nr:hypothetical protein [Thermoleophilia bacterium]
MIYRAIVKRKARGIFTALSAGDWRATTGDLAEDVHHVFPGGFSQGAPWAASSGNASLHLAFSSPAQTLANLALVKRTRRMPFSAALP